MATVPTYDKLTASPSAPGPQTFRTPSTSGGGDIAAQQISQLGKSMQNASAEAADLVLKAQQEANDLRVQDAINQLKTEQLALTYDPERGYTAQRGRAAVERESGMSLADEFTAQLGDTSATISNSLGNDAQRQAYARASADVGLQFRAGATSHEVREFQTYQTSVNEGTVKVASRSLAAGIFDPAYDDTTDRAAIDAAVRKQGKLTGMAPEDINASVAEALSAPRVDAVASALEADQPRLASAYLDKYGAEILPLQRAQLRAKVKDATDREDASAFQTLLQNADAAAEAAPVENGNVLSWPVLAGAPITSGVGPRPAPTAGASTNHPGIDFGVPEGTSVAAAGPGVVIEVDAAGKGGLGRFVRVRHPNGYVSTYAHLSTVGVKKDDTVAGGVALGASGNTGISTGPHLHFELRDPQDKPVDPRSMFGKPMPGGVAGPSLLTSGNLATAYAAADKAAGGDPHRQALFRGVVDDVYGRKKREDADREQAASDAVQPYLRPGSGVTSWTQIPASVWNRLSPQAQTSVQEHFERARESGPSDMGVKATLYDMMATNPKAFAEANLMTQYGGQLSGGDLEGFMRLQLQYREAQTPGATRGAATKPYTAPGMEDTNRVVNLVMPRKLKTEQQSMFKVAVFESVQQVIAAGGKPTEQDILQMANRMAVEVAVDTNHDGKPDGKRPLFEFGTRPDKKGEYVRAYGYDEIPRATRDQVVRALTARLGRAPNKGEVVNGYRTLAAAGVLN